MANMINGISKALKNNGTDYLNKLDLQARDFMKHKKEWRTCDRCGKEIKVGLLAVNSITRNGVLSTTYDLCNECMEDFWRFMRNEQH
mgnify:CR=1 FL=1